MKTEHEQAMMLWDAGVRPEGLDRDDRYPLWYLSGPDKARSEGWYETESKTALAILEKAAMDETEASGFTVIPERFATCKGDIRISHYSVWREYYELCGSEHAVGCKLMTDNPTQYKTRAEALAAAIKEVRV